MACAVAIEGVRAAKAATAAAEEDYLEAARLKAELVRPGRSRAAASVVRDAVGVFWASPPQKIGMSSSRKEAQLSPHAPYAWHPDLRKVRAGVLHKVSTPRTLGPGSGGPSQRDPIVRRPWPWARLSCCNLIVY